MDAPAADKRTPNSRCPFLYIEQGLRATRGQLVLKLADGISNTMSTINSI